MGMISAFRPAGDEGSKLHAAGVGAADAWLSRDELAKIQRCAVCTALTAADDR